jgi:hypothetical protein
MTTQEQKALELALEALQNPWKAGPDGVADAITAIKDVLEAHKALMSQSDGAQPEQEYTGAEFYSKEYWQGHDDAVRGVAMRWEQALTAPIPKAGVMNEPLESLYRRTEALRLSQPKKPEQRSDNEHLEPVAWVSEIAEEAELMLEKPRFRAVALYTTPPYVAAPRQRNPLTDERLGEMIPNRTSGDYSFDEMVELARAIEAAHGIHPTGFKE